MSGKLNSKIKEIKLKVAFMGLKKWLGHPFVLGHNNMNPLLKLSTSNITYRSLFSKKTKNLSMIESIKLYPAAQRNFCGKRSQFIICFKDSIFNFSGRVETEEDWRYLLDFFKEHLNHQK